MADVAAEAGVSPQTVSRVLRGHPNVSDVTRLLVEGAVAKTGYRRTGLARALVTGRSMTLGVMTHESVHHSAAALMLGITRAARERGYFVSAAGTTSVAPAAVSAGIEHLRDQGVDGLVVALPVWDEEALEKATLRLPTVTIDGSSPSAVGTINADQEEAGRIATRHLLEIGHETVWHVAGPTAWKDASGRSTGWEKELVAAGRSVPPVLYGDWTAESGYRNGLILARMPDATAVFVSSDEMALGLVSALVEHGRRVPEDISVVGMDDIPLARFGVPPLTTMRQPFEEMGRDAVRLVLDAVERPDVERQHLLVEPELVVRRSTGPAAG
ncbi:LacI family DNA-binding transcriptional regulator [Litorihabitans aurantiacus]|nr:substrate-binding domain-containing protein [Litorihabitans aurantiacus]